ncbi:MAG: hypothetical protein QE278_05440 [Limnobacter sp.]|nr:hypothetical protein [Limnobacter sp.]
MHDFSKKIHLTFALLLGMAAAPTAFAEGIFTEYSVMTGAGTTGVELSIGRPFENTPWVGRASIGRLSGEEKTTEGSINYNAKLKVNTSLLGADYHFFGGRFKGSLGLLVFGGDIGLEALATQGDTITIGNRRVLVAQGDFVRASFKFPSAAPYLGIGWSNLNSKELGLAYAVDLGVTVVSVDSTLDLSQNLQNQAGADQVAVERQKLQQSADDIKIYPVIRAALGYRF